MTVADTYPVRPVPAEVGSDDAATSASDRSLLGHELVRWSSRNSSKGALLLESVMSLQFLNAGHSLDELQQAIHKPSRRKIYSGSAPGKLAGDIRA
jgi:hypothetical protein